MTEGRSPQRLKFPEGFLWSAATAAHQIEGGNDNCDWWDFEAEPGRIKRGERSGRACDHWNRVAEDVALVQALHLNHYRFSVEWARIEPSPGVFDEAALAHYRRELILLRDAGIVPLVTLHHFTLPKWVATVGGWGGGDISERFALYCEKTYEALGDLARDWITINEPMVLVVAGYLSADFPPALREPAGIVAPLRGLVKGHVAAYHVMHSVARRLGRTLRVGLAHHLRCFDPARSWHPLDQVSAMLLGKAFNWVIPDALLTGKLSLRLPFVVKLKEEIARAKGTEDFFGLNYYSRDLIKFAPLQPLRFLRVEPPGMWRSDLGWEIYPRGIYRLLKEIAARYPATPILITENGLADAADTSRERFIREHLQYVHRAIGEGVKVEAYSHWSLLDNFEWAEGFEPRFGLCAVDYGSMQRTVRGSARAYARMAAENAVEP